MILAWVMWLIWRDRAALSLQATCGRSAAAVALFAFGLLLYAVGRSQALIQLEILSQIPVLLGIGWMAEFRARTGVRSVSTWRRAL